MMMLDWIEEQKEKGFSLPDLCGSDLVAAARSFPSDTAKGIDNIAPRAFERLSAQALESLAALLMACEKTGQVAQAC